MKDPDSPFPLLLISWGLIAAGPLVIVTVPSEGGLAVGTGLFASGLLIGIFLMQMKR